MSLVGLIPARGGSKGIPKKNVRLLGGRPLIAWTILEALAADGLDRVVVTTDDAEIAELAREYGAEVPFIRPPELAADDTPGIEPVLHALDQLPDTQRILLLQPTSPLRTRADIEGIISAQTAADVPAAVSVTEVRTHPQWTFAMSATGRFVIEPDQAYALRRQDLPMRYALNGALYLADSDWVRQEKAFITASTLMYPMPAERSIDIDTQMDWRIVEALLAQQTTE